MTCLLMTYSRKPWLRHQRQRQPHRNANYNSHRNSHTSTSTSTSTTNIIIKKHDTVPTACAPQMARHPWRRDR